MPYKWEACRGVGFSFGYNQNETNADHLNTDELIRLFVDIVSKNGNLLLNVGPMPDGTIPALQMQRLDALGAWIEINGAAIFGTRPWIRRRSDDHRRHRRTVHTKRRYAVCHPAGHTFQRVRHD